MTSHLLTCFSALSLLLPAANVTGQVELRDSKQSSVRKKRDFSGVVVWLEPASVPSLKPARATMSQKDKTFLPHVLAVTTGTTVDFPNYDPIFHNAFSNYDGQVFDVGLYPPGSSRAVRFSRPGIVRIFCNIHAQMSAVIVVLTTPYFATTSHTGAFSIPNVPPGSYTLRVFHERATGATLDALKREVTIGAEPQALPLLAISESGFLSVPHKNKHGHDYPPPPADEGFYPSVRK
jgi:plastocyanin